MISQVGQDDMEHGALSLAATRAISVDFCSSGYLDVSVPRVASSEPI